MLFQPMCQLHNPKYLYLHDLKQYVQSIQKYILFTFENTSTGLEFRHGLAQRRGVASRWLIEKVENWEGSNTSSNMGYGMNSFECELADASYISWRTGQ